MEVSPDVEEVLREVEGWISRHEGEMLYQYAKKAQGEGVILEIGSWKGRSACLLAKGSKAGASLPVHSVDPHRGCPQIFALGYIKDINTEPIFRENLEKMGVSDIVVPLVMTSEEAAKDWDKPIQLLLIDGRHEYECVTQDIKLWVPYVVVGGVVAVHDYGTGAGYPTVKQAVNELLLNRKELKLLAGAGLSHPGPEYMIFFRILEVLSFQSTKATPTPAPTVESDVLEVLSNVEGWMHPREAAMLYQYAKNISGDGVILEIGCWRGRSACLLARGSKAGKHLPVYAVDPHKGGFDGHPPQDSFPEFKRNLKRMGVEGIVVPMVMTSEEAAKDWDKPVRLLFIDGLHDYKHVAFDIKFWLPHVTVGGIVALHDYLEGGIGVVCDVKQAVDELILSDPKYKDIATPDFCDPSKPENTIFFRKSANSK